jgi:pyridoxal phosphate enzyme (YggS family)
MSIEHNVREILNELPDGVELVAVAKAQRPEAVLKAVVAGVKIVGENYVQEAERAYTMVGNRVRWHFIGHLQRNKAKKAVAIFDMIETIDSMTLAEEIDRRCGLLGKIMPVLVEVNSGQEKQKAGVLPEQVEPLVREISLLPYIRVKGLMTVGPSFGDPEAARPYFALVRGISDRLKRLGLPNVEMRHLSMGMTNSYKVAIEEGANIVRIGTGIFGARS